METSVQYPIGKFPRPTHLSPPDRARAIRAIAEVPGQLAQAMSGLTASDLAECYRPGGWKLRQVVHHLADSHLNAFVRFKLALTEDTPALTLYDEGRWAALPDGDQDDVTPSLQIITGVHQRWHRQLHAMSDAQWALRVNHPESGMLRLDQLLALYAWHGAHHTAQVAAYRDRRGAT